MTYQADGLNAVGAIRINAVADHIEALHQQDKIAQSGDASTGSVPSNCYYLCKKHLTGASAIDAHSYDIHAGDLVFTRINRPSTATAGSRPHKGFAADNTMKVMSVLTGTTQWGKGPCWTSPAAYKAEFAKHMRFVGVATRDVGLSVTGSLGKSSTHLAVNTSGLVTIFANECVLTGQEVLVDLPFPVAAANQFEHTKEWEGWKKRTGDMVLSSPGRPFRDTLRVGPVSKDTINDAYDKERADVNPFGGPWIIGKCVRGCMQPGQKIDVCLYDAPRIVHFCEDKPETAVAPPGGGGGGSGSGSGAASLPRAPSFVWANGVQLSLSLSDEDKLVSDNFYNDNPACKVSLIESTAFDEDEFGKEFKKNLAKTPQEATDIDLEWKKNNRREHGGPVVCDGGDITAQICSRLKKHKDKITYSGKVTKCAWVLGNGNCQFYAIYRAMYPDAQADTIKIIGDDLRAGICNMFRKRGNVHILNNFEISIKDWIEQVQKSKANGTVFNADFPLADITNTDELATRYDKPSTYGDELTLTYAAVVLGMLADEDILLCAFTANSDATSLDDHVAVYYSNKELLSNADRRNKAKHICILCAHYHYWAFV
jgi:hypothetical protein